MGIIEKAYRWNGKLPILPLALCGLDGRRNWIGRSHGDSSCLSLNITGKCLLFPRYFTRATVEDGIYSCTANIWREPVLQEGGRDMGCLPPFLLPCTIFVPPLLWNGSHPNGSSATIDTLLHGCTRGSLMGCVKIHNHCMLWKIIATNNTKLCY